MIGRREERRMGVLRDGEGLKEREKDNSDIYYYS